MLVTMIRTGFSLFFLFSFYQCFVNGFLSVDDLENHISPEDLKLFVEIANNESFNPTSEGPINFGNRVGDEDFDEDDFSDGDSNFIGDGIGTRRGVVIPRSADCLGVGNFVSSIRSFVGAPRRRQRHPRHGMDILYFMSSRRKPGRMQVMSGSQFGLEWVDYDPSRKTVVIVHGFMSHSNASWVLDMTDAFLKWGDVNVIAVDWSHGANTWQYWKSVAYTTWVGADIAKFLRQLQQATGCSMQDFHLVGHSLGAHICSFAAEQMGQVKRITGLDPAQPCFRTHNRSLLLDDTDADFVDIIHTNGRLLSKLGLGLPYSIGHADFYPNGGMRQPGCRNRSTSILGKLSDLAVGKLNQAICSHGRAYVLFTESLRNSSCSFISYRWNMSYYGVSPSMEQACHLQRSLPTCAVMGIDADGARGSVRAVGKYYAVTAAVQPFCQSEVSRAESRGRNDYLLHDLTRGFQIGLNPFEDSRGNENINEKAADADDDHDDDGDDDEEDDKDDDDDDDDEDAAPTTTRKPKVRKRWFWG